MTEKTLLLVDGSSFLYRAFHALPDMRSRDGEPTGAIYGMVAMLRRLRADAKLNRGATHGAVVFDPPGKTFRDDIYPEYKANRAEMPEDLRRQIPIIHELVRAMGWPLVMVPGLEADDVIGTLAARASAKGIHTLVSTGDKDLAQLVGERVTLFNTMPRDTGAIEWLDPAAVEEKFGVPPSRIVDWLSLVGDSVDNVPGVDKVGPKTAVKWLVQYGSLDGVIAHADEIPGKVGENLRAALGWLPTARELVTVKCDCELPPEIGDLDGALRFSEESLEELRVLFERCSFRTWLRDVEDRLAAKAGGAGAGALAAAELVAFDTETTSLDPMLARIVGLSLSVEPGHACYVPMAHDYAGAPGQLSVDEVLGRMRDWLEDPGARKVGQNLKYDMHVLENHGVRLAGVEHDTLLQSYVLEAHRSHDMDSLAARHLDRRTITYEEVAGKGA
jgi:DNA polymerase-1